MWRIRDYRRNRNIRLSGLVAILLSTAIAIVGCAGLLRETTGSGAPDENPTDISDSSDPSSSTDPTGTDGNSTEPIPEPPAKGDLMADIIPASWDGVLNPVDSEIAASVQRYSADLLLRSIDNDYNVMVSPASVFLALAMTLNGADNETRDEMIAVLSEAGLTPAEINEFSRVWINNLEAAGTDKTDISIANSIWFRDGFDADKAFLQTNADYYGAGARMLDFADESSKDIINNWVEYSTNGLIEEIIEQIDSSTVMFLINTVYFKSDWQTPFLHQDTYEREFNSPEGVVEHDFMNRSDMLSFFEMDGADGVVLPYDDGRFAYVAVLPDEGVEPRAWLSSQNQETLFADLRELAAEAEAVQGFISLPKYEAEYEDVLNNELIAMGMPSAFDGATADLSLLNEGKRKGLYISEVRHKTFIAVDEKGTEAAAATSVAIDESAIMSEKELIFDRPFFYTIIDLRNGLPLFAGILDNPV